MSLFNKGLYAINVIVMLVMLLSCFASYINPHHSNLFSLMALTFPIWACITILFLIYWVMVNPKYIYLSFIGIICCINSINNLIALDFGSSVNGSSKLKVVSFNIGGSSSYLFNYKDKKKTKENVSAFKKSFRGINADIYCIQENSHQTTKVLNELFGDYESFFFIKNGGTAIYSRFPILDSGKIDFGLQTNSGIFVDVKKGGKRIRVFNVHLMSNKISQGEIADVRDINKDYDQNIEETKGVLSKYGKQSLLRVKQIRKVLDKVEMSPHEVILCGDFNEPPQSYVYKEAVKKLQDSFREKGMGIGSTYAGKIPFLRIDYIFADHDLSVLDYEKRTYRWSDHYPIISTIGL